MNLQGALASGDDVYGSNNELCAVERKDALGV